MLERELEQLKKKHQRSHNYRKNICSATVKGHTSRILKDCPDVRKVIEAYVQDRNVGANAWRRTGVLTFDSSSKEKAIYEGIWEHLQSM